MAKEFAKAFYHSQAWRDAREAYVSRRQSVDGGMCEACRDALGEEVHHKTWLRPENIHDENVTLNPENFLFLCGECHRRIHEAARALAQRESIRRDNRNPMQHHGYFFDDQGAIQPVKVIIVWGSPGAGKSTYVREHKEPEDLVVDLDLLSRAVCMADRTDIPPNAMRLAYDIRDVQYDQIASRTADCHTVWVIAGLPMKRQREELKARLQATDMIYIPSTFSDCYRHALLDDERRDKTIQLGIIERWWRRYEPE